MRYRLRTLMILLVVLPPIIAMAYWFEPLRLVAFALVGWLFIERFATLTDRST